MNELLLSERLEKVASYIPEFTRKFADIGSDHAYLPCYVCLNNLEIHAVAGEVNKGPYLAAKRQVEKLQLQNQIDVRLGDGLAVVSENEVDCVIIAGMGGTLIAQILTEGISKLTAVSRLILQPNIDAQAIREFAVNYQFEIVQEEIIDDEGYIYEILILEPSQQIVEYTEKQKYLGPILLENKNEVFYEKWGHVLNKKQKIINQMKEAKDVNYEKINFFMKQTQWIEEEINHDNSNR